METMQAGEDRRRFTRHPLHVPVNVSTRERRARAGIIRDVSASGVLFHSRSAFAIGDRVTVMFFLAHVNGTTTGQVVRAFVDPRVENRFPHVTAVRFDAPLLDLPL
jgi:hypothetical protein